MARLIEKYKSEVVPKMMERFSYGNVNAVPRLQKITLNMGVGRAVENNKRIDAAAKDMAAIAGQKPVVTQARQSIAGFKLRQGMNVGVKVTLRGERMYEFMDRLINIALPRVRDFRGISPRSFDGRGNFALGIKEQIIFPEINYDRVERIRGMDVVICTTADTDEEAKALLTEFNVPFAN